MKKITILILVLLVSQAYAKKSSAEKEALPKVYTSKLLKKTIYTNAEYLGTLVARKKAALYSPIEGVVTKLLAKPGLPIKKGQALAEIQQNVIGLEVMPIIIKAPISGNLFRSQIRENMLVTKNFHLFTIFKPHQYNVHINVTPEDGDGLFIGKEVNARVGDISFKGKVLSVSPDLDIQTGTRLVEIELEKKINKKLHPGLVANVLFQFNKRDSFVVQKKNLKKKSGKDILRVINGKGLVEEIPVVINSSEKTNVEITSKDLVSGQEFIIKSSVEPLQESQKVQVIKPVNNSESEKSAQTKKG